MKIGIKMNAVNKKKYSYFAFITIFIICIIYAFYRGPINPIYDSFYYSSIGDGVVDKTGIHINLFPKTFRGCILPIFIQLISNTPCGIDIGWKIIGSLVSSTLFVFIIPKIINGEGISNIKHLVGVVISAFVYIYIWGDYIVYPLSDLIAFFFMAITALNCKKIIRSLEFERSSNLVDAFIMGFAAYIAYNTRCIYLYGILLLVLMIIVTYCVKRKFTNLIISLIVMGIGIFVIALPQCFVNSNCENAFSPRVYTENYSSSAKNLQMQQIVWGLQYPRYETYMGDYSEYSSPAVFFEDSTGCEIIEKEEISEDTFSVKKWVKLVMQYPLDMLSIYTRHLINAMTPLWNRTYISVINTNKLPLICISFGIWVITILGVLQQITAKTIKWINFLVIIFVCVPALMQIMGAVEVRFFLPVYILAYSYTSVGIDYSNLLKWCVNKWLPIAIVLVVVFCIWLTVISSTLANNIDRKLLINDKNIIATERTVE